MSIGTRLDQLTSALSAKERALLVLRSMKEKTPEDPAWRHSMPPNQVNEFNRYIGLMNVANRELSLVIGVLARDASELDVREAWLVSLTLWQEHIDEIRRAMRLTLREPITESEYRHLTEAYRAEWVQVQELAELLAGAHEGWQDSDYGPEEDGEREVSDEAWDRVVAEKETELRSLVVAGSLPGKGKGRRLRLEMGPFNDLVWHKAGIVPEDYLSYRIVPDSQADEVERERRGLKRLQRVLDWQDFDADPDTNSVIMPAKLSEALRRGIAGQLISCWVQVRTAEVVLDEIGAEFGGVDPLKPHLREELLETKQGLLRLQDELLFLNMEVVLREPLEEELENLREWVRERAAL